MSAETTHNAHIGQSWLEDGWEAGCSCGWNATGFSSHEAAGDAVDSHYEMVGGNG